MYNITSAHSNDCSAGNTICWSKISFKWPHQTMCSGKLVCDKMTGNICGNYGLVFTKNESQSICQERGTIGGDDFWPRSKKIFQDLKIRQNMY